MKIEKLSAGQIIKNYKELCLELEMEIKSSKDTKNAQFKELARFCKYSRSGNKFIIEEIYDSPLPKVDNRGKSEGSRNNNNVYGESIQLLISDLLAQCKNGHLSISRGKLLFLINMINENYRVCGENVKKLSKYADIEESIIYDFYNTNNSNFKSAVETALKQLMDKRIIWFDTITKVYDTEKDTHRSATAKEKEIILDYEKKVLDDLGYKQVSIVRKSKDWKIFKVRVKDFLTKETTIEYYYQAYDIVVNDKYLEEERKELYDLLLKSDQRTFYKNKLNITVQKRIIEYAQKRKIKASNIDDKKFRKSKNYIDDIAFLVDLLINNKTDSILEEVLNTETVQGNLTDEEIYLLEEVCDDIFA
jgi:hypothetical protein